MKLDARARQDVAFLGSEFLKLDGKHFSATILEWHKDLGSSVCNYTSEIN